MSVYNNSTLPVWSTTGTSLSFSLSLGSHITVKEWLYLLRKYLGTHQFPAHTPNRKKDLVWQAPTLMCNVWLSSNMRDRRIYWDRVVSCILNRFMFSILLLSCFLSLFVTRTHIHLCVGVSGLLQLFSAILSDCKLLFISSSMTALTSVMMALRAIIYPLDLE